MRRAASTSASRRLWIDLVVAAALLVGSGVWATRYWNAWTAHGGAPSFYQQYFEPAVMIACGKGFVIAEHQPKPLEDFLWLRRDTFDCRDIPDDLRLGQNGIYQRAMTYLQLTVGWSWRLLGISWSGMGPLFGLLFGIVIALAYAIFRIGAGRLCAVLAASGLAVSSTHLLNLPHLRDYAKAPFTLALILILGVLVIKPPRPRTVLLCAFAYGAVLGIGYGFRTDFLANVPILVIALFAFLEGGLTRNLGLKAAATVLYLVTFVAVSWPASSAVYQRGGCQWHVALLGLQSPFDASLGLIPAPYDFGDYYADGYIERVANGYARRTQPGFEHMVYCSHEYDVQSGRYLRDIALTFPADLAVRAAASVIQIVELPFRRWAPPMEGWFPSLYRARAVLVPAGVHWGACLTVAAVLLTSAVSLRLGLFLVFFLAYFGGYPAIQFQERHYFHLEFMTWWAAAFVAHQLVVGVWSLKDGRPDLKPLARRAVTAGLFGVGGMVLAVGVLLTARWYQVREARRLFAAYSAAPKVAVPNPAGPLEDIAPTAPPQFLEVDLNEAACGDRPAVTFRYDRVLSDGDFTWTVTIDRRTRARGTTRILMPVFERFAGLELSDDRPGCFAGAFRVTDLRPFPILVGATLPPDWEELPLYQRLAWEGERR